MGAQYDVLYSMQIHGGVMPMGPEHILKPAHEHTYRISRFNIAVKKNSVHNIHNRRVNAFQALISYSLYL